MADKDRFDNFCEGVHEAAIEFDGFNEKSDSFTVIAMNTSTKRINLFGIGREETAMLAFATQMYKDDGFLHLIKQAYALQKEWRNQDSNEIDDAIIRMMNEIQSK